MFRKNQRRWGGAWLAAACGGGVLGGAQADSLEQLGVIALAEGAGDASRARAVALSTDAAQHVISGGAVRVDGVWLPAWWPTPTSEPTILECLGNGGGVQDVLYEGEIRAGGFCYDASGVEQPMFWETWEFLWLMPTLPGGGVVRDVVWDSSSGVYAMCGTSIDGGGQQFAVYWTLELSTGNTYFALLSPLSNFDSFASHIGRAPDGQTRIVGWSEDGAETPRAVYWDIPLTAGPPTELLEIAGGDGAHAASMATLANGAKIFAGDAYDALGNTRPVGWASDSSAPIELGSDGFDDASVEKLILVDDAIYLFGSATNPGDLDHAYGWIYEGGAVTTALDLNTIVFDDAAPYLRAAHDAVARTDAGGTRVFIVGGGRDDADVPQAFVARQLDVADINGDGVVDLSDLGTVLANYGTSSGATRADGDLDGDGDVDLSDLGIVLSSYGSHV